MILRPYQSEIIDEARRLMSQGVRSILLQAPTGSGKTLLTAHMLKTAAEKGFTSWFTVHRRELVKQSIRAFSSVGLNAGVVSADFPTDYKQPVQICSVQTLAKRFHKLQKPKLIVWDECHHLAAGSWTKIHAAFPEAFHIGLTATPERLDGSGLDTYFKTMIKGPEVSWMIENKFLAPYRLFAPPGINTSDMHTRMGDYAKDELSKAADKPRITGDAISHYKKYASGKRAVVFCVSIEHSKHVVGQFNEQGIVAEHVDGETQSEVRDNAIKNFESGRTLVLSNVELFGEGFDLPAIEVAILLRPTQSLGMFLQQCGRVLRPCVGKQESIILDHSGNTLRHGLPDDPREWSLAGREKKKSDSDTGPAVRVCPVCFACQVSLLPKCGYCGHVYAIQSREVQQVEGDLVEIDPAIARIQQRREQGQAQTLEELIAIGKARKMRNPWAWAHFVFQARQAKKLARVA